MIICDNCGNMVSDGSSYCNECGKPISHGSTFDATPNPYAPRKSDKLPLNKSIKHCSKCGSTMDVYASICPVCNSKMGSSTSAKLVAVAICVCFVFGLIILFKFSGLSIADDNDMNSLPTIPEQYDVQEKQEDTKLPIVSENKSIPSIKEEAPVNVKYIVTTAKEMMDDLDNNALAAERKWQDKYVEVSGALNTIDSDGSYITLAPADAVITIDGKKSVLSFLDLQCYIKNDAQLDKVLTMRTGEIYTIKGKVTSIGEVLGYSLDIIEIK